VSSRLSRFLLLLLPLIAKLTTTVLLCPLTSKQANHVGKSIWQEKGPGALDGVGNFGGATGGPANDNRQDP